jgi:hypothetical protein
MSSDPSEDREVDTLVHLACRPDEVRQISEAVTEEQSTSGDTGTE